MSPCIDDYEGLDFKKMLEMVRERLDSESVPKTGRILRYFDEEKNEIVDLSVDDQAIFRQPEAVEWEK